MSKNDFSILWIFLAIGVSLIFPYTLLGVKICDSIYTNSTISNPDGSGGGSNSTVLIPIIWELNKSTNITNTIRSPRILINDQSDNIIKARTTLQFQSNPVFLNSTIMNPVQVLFDGVTKKNNSVIISTIHDQAVKTTLIEVNLYEIIEWADGIYGDHILDFIVPDGVTYLIENVNGSITRVKIIGDTQSFKVSIQPPKIFRVSVSGSKYTSTDEYGKIIYTGSSASNAIQIAINQVPSGYLVEILGGKYSISSTIIVKSDIQVQGVNSPILRNSRKVDAPILKVVGDNSILQGIVFDDNGASGVGGTVYLQGTGSILLNNTLGNCIRYGFTVAQAHQFKIINCTVTQAQHGISGSTGFDGQWNPSTDGIIEGNKISGMIIHGIKLKNFLNVTVRNNLIDLYPFYPTYPNKTQTYAKTGIVFGSGDASNIDCIVEGNILYESTPTSFSTYAIRTSTENPISPLPSTGNKIMNNDIKDAEYGIQIKGNNYNITENTLTGVTNPIQDLGKNNVFTDNLILS